MRRSTFKKIEEYSCSLPSCASHGMAWKRRVPYTIDDQVEFWLIGEYVFHPDPDFVGLDWQRIEIIVKSNFGEGGLGRWESNRR